MSVPGRPGYDLANQVVARENFVAFVEALRSELRGHAADGESTSLDDYLEALGRYVEDMGPTLEEIVQERWPSQGCCHTGGIS